MTAIPRRALGAAAALAALPATAQTDNRRGGTLVMYTFSTRHVNPAIQSGTPAGMPGTQVFASPLRFDDKWNALPYLARAWELAPDGKSLTLKLVEGAVFHDGKPITSEDVAFSIALIQKNHPFKTMLEPVERVDTPDPLTAIIRMSRPHPAILLAMSPALCPILPKHVYGDGRDILTHPANTAPVGSGPFRLTEFKPGESITLERHDKFFIPGRPYLDKIVMRMISDQQTVLLAIERDEINWIPLLGTVRDAERLAKSPNLQVTDKGFGGIGALNWLAMNTAKKPLDDKRVRQAFAYLSDRPRMLKVLMGGRVRDSLTPIHPDGQFHTTDVNRFPFDVKKAEALLDEAGYKRGADGTRFKITIDFIPGAVEISTGMAEFLKAQFKRGGVELELRPSPDFPSWAQRVSSLEFDTTLDAVFNWGDPVIGVHRTYLSRNIRKGVIWSNTQSYNNPRVDALLDAAAGEPDINKRRAMYKEFQQIVVDDVPILFLHPFPYAQAANKGLRDLPTTIWGPAAPWDEIWWEASAPPVTGWLIQRLLHAAGLVLAVLVLNFLLIHLAPGDPALVIAGEMGGASAELLARIRATYGLDQPLPVQLGRYLAQVLTGDLGQSVYFNRPVASLVFERMGATALLVVTAILAALVLGTWLGVLAARRPRGLAAQVVSVFSVAGFAAPVFWTGMMLLLLFASVLPLFPVSGMADVGRPKSGLAYALDVAHHLVLPAVTLALVYMAQYSRQARAGMLAALAADYIRTARAKGLAEGRVVYRHALRNALIPVITIAGLQFGQVLAGAVLVETVYSWPGLGRLAYESILRRDSPTLLGILLGSAIMVIVANLLTDAAYRLADPRMRGA